MGGRLQIRTNNEALPPVDFSAPIGRQSTEEERVARRIERIRKNEERAQKVQREVHEREQRVKECA